MAEDEKRGYVRGVVYVIARAIEGDPISAEELWYEAGLSRDDLSVCDEYDAKVIRKMLMSREMCRCGLANCENCGDGLPALSE